MSLLFGIQSSSFWRAAAPALVITIAPLYIANAAEVPAFDSPQPAWGRIVPETNGTGAITLEVSSRPRDGKLSLPQPFPNFATAILFKGVERESLKWVFEPDSRRLFLEAPTEPSASATSTIMIETCEKTQQFTGGRIVFSGSDAQGVRRNGGSGQLQLAVSDSASWDFKPTRWGMYDIELSYSSDAAAKLQIEAAGRAFAVTAPPTGSLFHFATLPVGRFYLAKAEPFTLSVNCKALKVGEALNLVSVTFRPAPESPPIVQEATDITLRASNAITHSVTMRYEPATNKNCLGYWVNQRDWAEWEFTVTHPGPYEIQLWQGCGKGNGGSEVQVESGGRKFVFHVVDTGDYHKLTSLPIGRVEFPIPGRYSLAVRPLDKKAGAIMDIQQVKLIPAQSP